MPPMRTMSSARLIADGAPDISQHDVDAVAVGDGIDFALHFFGGHRADVERVQVGEIVAGRPAARGLERVIADVRDDDGARAAVLRDRRGHRADRTEAGDGDRLAGQVADLTSCEPRCRARRETRRRGAERSVPSLITFAAGTFTNSANAPSSCRP